MACEFAVSELRRRKRGATWKYCAKVPLQLEEDQNKGAQDTDVHDRH